MKRFLLLIITVVIFNYTNAQLIVVPSNYNNLEQFVNNLFAGNGVSIFNVSFNGSTGNSWNNFGSFTTAMFPTNLGFKNGLILATGGITGAAGPNNSGGTSIPVSPQIPDMSDPDLLALLGGAVTFLHDAAILEFDFIPDSDTVSFNYVFASEEYPEYVSSVNDAFAIFISGLNPSGPNYDKKNIALIPGTNIPVNIFNLNNGLANTGPCVNCQYYINNTGGTGIQADGFTTALKALANVVPFTTYHLKIVIADAKDRVWDSWLFLEANSFSNNLPSVTVNYSEPSAKPMAIEGCINAYIKFKIPNAQLNPIYIPLTISGTAINGSDYLYIPDTLIIMPGQTSEKISIVPIIDNMNEAIETIIIKSNSPLFSSYFDSIEIKILSREPISLKISNDTSICQENPTQKISIPIKVIANGGSGALTYSWQPASLLNSSTIFNPVATPFSTTQFMVYVTDTTECPATTSSVLIQINEVPEISFLYENSIGCLPLTSHFENQTIPQYSTYIWYFGDGDSSNVISPTHTYQNSGFYNVTLIASSSESCKSSFTAVQIIQALDIPAIPVITKHGDTLFANDPFNCIYQWYLNESLIPGATQYFHIPDQIGYYTVVAQNSDFCYSLPSLKILSIDQSVIMAKNLLLNNPTADYFGIRINPIVTKVEILDYRGILLKLFLEPNDNNIYNVGDLAKGIYIVRIYADSLVNNLKLIKY